ncbi:MAG: Ig-like domain-containing protein [Paludibacteraceae bacterium]|nr:Ig-like domain-containing protein [Paludibacteraceae bacterium]
MRKLLLITLIALLSTSLWAADVTYKEAFGTAPTGGAKTTRYPFNGYYSTWYYNFARSKTTDKIGDDRAFWTDHKTNSADNKDCYLETTIEGGLKAVSFKWQQGNTGDYPDNLYLGIEINDVQVDYREAASVNASITANPYSHTFAVKENNVKFALFNRSTTTRTSPTDIGRILIGPITITPYLLYTQKDVTIGLKQKGYYNGELINNTNSEGAISYSSSATDVAIVDEDGIITPFSAGDAIITATWSEGVTTTYTLHVVDGILAENFSKVKQTSQTTGAEWNGDLFTWEVANVRRGTEDTLGLNPRIQATAMRKNAGSSLVTKEVVEGGVKHVAFDWRQWASGTAPLTIDMYYSSSKDTWGDAVATQSEDAVGASTPHSFSEDIDDGAKGNAYLKLNYTSGAGYAVLGALKITPWLLYTTKEATLDTRVGLTYTNSGLINNTTGDAPTYSIAPANAAVSINSATGQVAVEDGADVTADFIVTASWSSVTTTYTLHIISRVAAEASYPNTVVSIGLNGSIDNTLAYTDGYDGTIAYTSSNTAVATVASNGTVSLAGGVGQTTITATLPQTSNYKAASASYILYVEDNSASVQVEAFSEVPVGNAAAHMGQLWQGDVCEWRVSADGGVRKNSDKFASDQTRTGIWMGTPDPNTSYGSLTAENGVEGGIKHIWFYCEQPYNTSETGYTLKPVIYLNSAIEANKVGEVEVVGTSGADNIAANRQLFGASNVMKSNGVLIIRNESFKTDDGTRPAANSNRGRLLLDNIHITPYLLYTDKTKQTLRVGGTYTRTPDIDNTGDETGTLTYSSSNPDVATVNSEGQVTAVARGTATITAKFAWSVSEYVTTTYEVEVFPVNCETFSQNATAHTYQTAQYGNSYTNPEAVEEDKCTWYVWLGGVVPSNYEPNVAIIRAPHTDEQGPAYIYSGTLTGGIASMTFDWNLVANESNVNWDIRVLVNGREVKRLANADLSMEVLPSFGQIPITDINEPDNFVIRFENHSTIDGEYTSGNKARFVIDNITWTSYSGAKTLLENIDNSSWLTEVDGQSRDVNTDRTLVAGVWNTLCLPFAISKSTDLGGADVQELNSATLNAAGDELTIGFTAIDGDELAAGTPYLVKPTSAIALTGFTGKTIEASPSSVTKGIVTLQGIFNPTELTANDKTTLFVGNPDGEGNNLFYPGETGDLKGMRAYFKLSTPSGAPTLRRARFIVNEAQSPTALDEADNALQSSRKVLENGHLFIIRDGKKYNVTGQKIQ